MTDANTRYFVHVKPTSGKVTMTWTADQPFDMAINQKDDAATTPKRTNIAQLHGQARYDVQLDARALPYELLLGPANSGDLQPSFAMRDRALQFHTERPPNLATRTTGGASVFMKDPKNPWPTPGGVTTSVTTIDDDAGGALGVRKHEVRRIKALLFASEVGGVIIEPSVARVQASLLRSGFPTDIHLCVSPHATSERVRAELRWLVETSKPDDTVVLYYMGHSALVDNPDYAPAAVSGPEAIPQQQFIFVDDFGSSSEDDLRLIAHQELADVVAQLPGRNVVTLMETCYSLGMSRDDLRLQSLDWPSSWYVPIQKMLANRPVLKASPTVPSRERVVSISAAGRAGKAWLYQEPSTGQQIGIMTGALTDLLDEAAISGVTPTWAELAWKLEARIAQREPTQVAQIEGPIDRLLFSTEERPRNGVARFFRDGGFPSLDGGRLLGMELGDEYRLSRQVVATVSEVSGSVARVTLDPENADVPDGSSATPIRKAGRHAFVRLEGREAHRLDEDIQRSLRLGVAAADSAPVIASVAPAKSEGLELLDSAGRGLVTRADTKAGIAQLVNDLELLAEAQVARTLAAGAGVAAPADGLKITWGVVYDGEIKPSPEAGADLGENDRYAVRLHKSAGDPIWVSLLEINPLGRVSVVSDNYPEGIALGDGLATFTLGLAGNGDLRGRALDWPAGLPAGARETTLLCIISARRLDLRPLTTRGITVDEKASSDARSAPLEAVRVSLRQIDLRAV